MSIDHCPVFFAHDAHRTLQNLQDKGVHKEIEITIAPEKKLSLQNARRAVNNCGLFAPTTRWDDTAAITEDAKDPPFMD